VAEPPSQPSDADPLAGLRLDPPSWSERAERLVAAATESPLRLAGAAVVVLVAGAGLGWLVLAARPPSTPVEATLPTAPIATTAASAPTTDTTTGRVVVHAAGAVAAPGVYELDAGARVADAVAAAGGLAADADADRLNLAGPVADGARVYVPRAGEEVPDLVGAEGAPTGSEGGGGAGGGAPPAGPVDLNQADEALLDTLPGVGPATAQAIVAHRDEHGPFTSVDQLIDVRGIGEAKLAQLRDLVTV
jgi:competence protein ComEA